MRKNTNKTKSLHGIIPPLITPLTENRELDEEALKKIIDHCIDGGIHGIFSMGSSGETSGVSRRIWKRVNELTIKHVSGRVPVLCGAIDTGTERVIESIKELEYIGAEIAVVTPSFYIRNTCQDEIIRHFEEICSRTQLKVAVYNIPVLTNVNIKPEIMIRLKNIENIVAFKDSCGDWEQVQKNIFYLKDSDICYFNGAEELAGVSIFMGADGCIPGLANFFPELFVNLYHAALECDKKNMYENQRKVTQIRSSLSVGNSWVSAMKYLGSKFGFGTEKATWPIEPLTKEQKLEIDRIIEEFI